MECTWQGQVQGSLYHRYPKPEAREDRLYTGSAQGKAGSGLSKSSGKKVSLQSYSPSQRQLESSEPCEAGQWQQFLGQMEILKSVVSGVDGNSEICPSLRASLVSKRQVMKDLIRGEKIKISNSKFLS